MSSAYFVPIQIPKLLACFTHRIYNDKYNEKYNDGQIKLEYCSDIFQCYFQFNAVHYFF